MWNKRAWRINKNGKFCNNFFCFNSCNVAFASVASQNAQYEAVSTSTQIKVETVMLSLESGFGLSFILSATLKSLSNSLNVSKYHCGKKVVWYYFTLDLTWTYVSQQDQQVRKSWF